ncbi:MAG: chemotaxis protein CheC [Candidatus Omnitrophota bacterium]
MDKLVLTELQKDALKEMGNICSGNAATALSQLFDRKITIEVPRIFFLPIEEVANVVGGADKLVVGLILRVLGDIPSTILFIFSQKDARSLASFMTGKQISNGSIIGDLEGSALKEIGVILANAYLGALGNFVGISMVPTVPELIIDMAGAMVDYLLIELSCKSEYALLIESEFKEMNSYVLGHFFLIPNASGMEAILKTVDKKIAE